MGFLVQGGESPVQSVGMALLVVSMYVCVYALTDVMIFGFLRGFKGGGGYGNVFGRGLRGYEKCMLDMETLELINEFIRESRDRW